MLPIKVLFILATILVSLSSVFAVESSSLSADPKNDFFAVEGVTRLLAEEIDDHHNHDNQDIVDFHDSQDKKFQLCHCEGTLPHCLGEGGKELEAMCVCKNGEPLCSEDFSAGVSSDVIGSATTIAAIATVVAIAL